MRKICIVMLLVLALFVLIACNGETTTATTTTGAPTTTTDPDSGVNPPVEGERLVTENYTAILNAEEWTPAEVDLSQYEVFGTGGNIYSKINSTYSQYARTFVVVQDGVETTLSSVNVMKTLKNMGLCGADVTLDEANKKATVKVTPVEAKVLSSWSGLTAKAGTYVMFEFTASLDLTYAVTVTTTPGGSQTSAIYTQDDITVTGKDGKYTGTAKCTVPYQAGRTFYINICAEGGGYPVLASIPVNTTEPKYDLPFQFIFQGDWDLIEDKSYVDNLYEVLYNSYPRAYQRWAVGNEATVLYVVADRNSKEIAYNAGDKVVVQVGYANSSPADVGLFAHEFTHAVQGGYGISYGGGWFTEAMADYGRFRFFHWGYSTKYIKEYDQDDPNIRDFHGDGSNGTNWHGYAQHNYFMAYLDWVWPTVDKNGNGKVDDGERGLIDHIVYQAKLRQQNGESAVNDNPHTVGSIFNGWVKEITGLETMEEVRLQYVKELDEGTWEFKGFRDYQDNWLIEDCWDVPNLTYPMKEKLEPTAKTSPVLQAAMTTGDNLCKDAVVRSSAAPQASDSYPMSNLIDGDLTTRFQASRSDGLYKLNGIHNEIVIDLGSEKTFDTYTLACYDKQSAFIAKSWEILVSTDGSTYTAIDYQKDNKTATVSVSFDDVTARYVKIRFYQADGSGGSTRLNEFMLFDANK